MFAAGSERKVSGTDVHIGLTAIGDGFARGSTGRSKITVHRDRRGFLKNGTLGELVIESDPESGAIAWSIHRRDPENTRPTGMMEQTSRHLEVVGVPHRILAAISLGAVFMGANTYIGNGPNFMVRSIAESRGVKMPSFGGYMLYSGAVLLPVFLVVTLVFFARG